MTLVELSICVLSILSDSPGQWQQQVSGTDASLRGVAAVNDQVAWASGAGGTVLRTTDGGKHWRRRTIAGAEALDFRDVSALDDKTAMVISAGSPARVYRTTDGGQSWQLRFSDDRPEVFFDAMQFWDAQKGLAFSDPLDGRLFIIRTSDSGRSWQPLAKTSRPVTLDGEAGFAASGSCLAVFGQRHAWIGLGGQTTSAGARVALTADGGRSWQFSVTPIKTSASAGIFSLAFQDERVGVAVGGDYRQPDKAASHVAITRDGGKSWSLVQEAAPGGYRSVVTFVPGTRPLLWLAAGPNGTDYSFNAGKSWAALGDEGFHAMNFSRDGSGWAVGSEGRIARWEPLAR